MNALSTSTSIFVIGLVIGLMIKIYMNILRTASFNPIDWIWGPRLYDITQIDQDDLLIVVDQFPDDEYMIDWRIAMTETYRDNGPWFGRKRKLVEFTASWAAIESGIPTNRGYIRDTWSGAFPIKDPFDWRYDACEKLVAWVKEMRHINGYVGHVTSTTESEIGMEIGGIIFDEDLKKILSYDGFGAPISNPIPDEIITSTSDNDLLKSRYTIEELAQQAINRDNEGGLWSLPCRVCGRIFDSQDSYGDTRAMIRDHIKIDHNEED